MIHRRWSITENTSPKCSGILVLLVLMGNLIWGSVATAESLIWVDVEESIFLNSTNQGESRKQALQAAERSAVYKALGEGITFETLLVNFRLSGSILTAIPFGRVVEKKILKEGVEEVGKGDLQEQPRYSVHLKAGVVEQSGRNDPAFRLNTQLNHSIFQDGEELEITIRSSKTCYFAVLNILEDSKIYPLLPNERYQNNYLPAGETFVFPGVKDRRKGFKIRLHLPEGKSVVSESIYVVALLQPFLLKSHQGPDEKKDGPKGRKDFLQDLICKVMAVPHQSRAEALVQYEIRKAGKRK